MTKSVATVLAVVVGVGIGWTAGHLGLVVGGAELLVAAVLGVALELWIGPRSPAQRHAAAAGAGHVWRRAPGKKGRPRMEALYGLENGLVGTRCHR